MYKGKIRTIITVAFLIVLNGIVSVSTQDVSKERAGNAEDNMARMDALMNQQMNSDGQIRIVARLGKGETKSSLNKKRLEAARSYLVETRGLKADKLSLVEGEKVDGLGRLEFYLDDALLDIILTERGEDTSFWCCGGDVPEPESKAKKTKVSKDSKVEMQIIALEKQAWESWENKDLAFFQTYLTDDALSVNASGIFEKAEILEYYGSCDVKSYSLDNFKFRMIEKNSALITFTATQDAVCGGEKNPSTVRASSVYVKRGGKWLNSFYTETAATPDNSSVESQIIALEKQAWEEWKNGNKKFVENYLADDAFFVYSEGVVNKSQVVEGVGSCKFNNYSLEGFKFKLLDNNSALISYTANQDIVCDCKPAPKAVRSTSVYVKRNGKWLSTFYTETAEVQ